MQYTIKQTFDVNPLPTWVTQNAEILHKSINSNLFNLSKLILLKLKQKIVDEQSLGFKNSVASHTSSKKTHSGDPIYEQGRMLYMSLTTSHGHFDRNAIMN